jgi:ribosome assembly protein 3
MAGREVNKQEEANFSAYYLQQLTHELSDDLDKVRAAEDFKPDSVPFLVHALRQGASQLVVDKNAVTQTGPAQQKSNN